jgi:hypothetical protein
VPERRKVTQLKLHPTLLGLTQCLVAGAIPAHTTSWCDTQRETQVVGHAVVQLKLHHSLLGLTQWLVAGAIPVSEDRGENMHSDEMWACVRRGGGAGGGAGVQMMRD